MAKQRNSRMRAKFKSYDFFDEANVEFRVCSMCGQPKVLVDNFALNGFNLDTGEAVRRYTCKTCYNAIRRENATKKKHTDFIGSMKRRGEEGIQYSQQEWKETVVFFGGQCCYCGRTMRKGERLTKDHLVPISVGGRTVQSNIVPACSTCNSSKGKTEWRTWFMQQPFFSQERMNKLFTWRSIMGQFDADWSDDV